MPNDVIYQSMLFAVLIWALIGFVVTRYWMQAPYGHHDNWSEKHWRIQAKWAWFFMESPAAITFALFFVCAGVPQSITAWALCGLWMLHYIHRGFIYPFRMRHQGERFSVLIASIGGLYCAVNGYLNGLWVGHYGQYTNDWLSDPRFAIGVGIYFLGYALNKHSDHILINLRKPGETGYRIPYGGAFRWVSSPNYLGEIITWLGFAIACWSFAGASFALMTICNLVPRALTHHQWYREKFADYPAERKAIIPLLL